MSRRKAAMPRQQRSLIGTYEGYSEETANAYLRTSQYVTVRDGTRLAIDILHPALDGCRLNGAHPTVIRGTGYRRSFRKAEQSFYDVSRKRILAKYPVGAVITPYELAPNAALLVNHGYNFVSVDFRGTGASFGQNTTLENGRDLADVIDWIAVQDWSDGKIGMWGRSWEAWVQLDTAAARPKNLTCLMPCALNTGRNAIFYNGVYIEGFARAWSAMRAGQDGDEPAMPVDGPDGARLRDAARAQARASYAHQDVGEETVYPLSEFIDVEQRSQAVLHSHLEGSAAGELKNPWQKLDAINACGAAIYVCGGWWDMSFVNDQFSFFENFTVPKKLLIGPWTHSQFEFGYEPLRWFDYWLKGIDNGVMEEPAVHYATSGLDGSMEWHGAECWAEISNPCTDYYGVADGGLATDVPDPGTLSHTVDNDITNGRATRTRYMFYSEFLKYPRLDERATRGLCFTTAPAEHAFDITGLPSVHFELSCDRPALSLLVTLEQIDSTGVAHYLTEGVLNLKHRKLATPPWRHIEPHWHSENEIDALPVCPGEVMSVDIDMFALSCRIAKGCRLRLVISASDTGNYEMPVFHPPAVLNLALGKDRGVRLSLPVARPGEGNPPVEGAFLDDHPGYAFHATPVERG